MPRGDSRKTSIWISRAQKARDLQENKWHITLHWSLLKGNKSPPGSKAIKPLRILGKSQAVRSIKRKHSWHAWEQNANISAGVSLKISLFKQVLAQELSLWRMSCMSWCQTPGRRAARLLMESCVNPRRGISWHPAMPPASSVCQRARNACQRWQDCFSLSVAETGTQPY